MPTSFKTPKPITIVKKTPTDDLVLCDECGGLNAMASTAVKIDCPVCGTTGYSNYYQRIGATAYYRPGAIKRWDAQAGAVSYVGECSIKLDAKYKRILSQSEYVEFDGLKWRFSVQREPGEGFGQHRLVLALTRK